MNRPKVHKPDWLKALEAQSWQAELIASGLAIYGSLSLGTYLDDITQWAIPRYNDRTLLILYFTFLYVYTAHALLVVSFITHLGLRILWAGILGLSSVYPQGINDETTAYSESYKKKLIKDFPDLSAYSLTLDKFCSLIFSILCAMVITLASITFWLLIYLLVSQILGRFISVQIIDWIGVGLLVILMSTSIIASLLTQTKLKDSKLGEKYGYKMSMIFGRVMYFVGFKAFTYITQTIRTNVTSKLFFLGMGAVLIGSMLLALPRFFPIVPYYQETIWADHQAHPSEVAEQHYLDAFKSSIILEPVIQSEIIEENYLELFIPRYQREAEQKNAACESYTWDDELSKFENKTLRSEVWSACANTFYQLKIDDQAIENYDFARKKHPHKKEIGYQAFIPIDSLELGRHVLTIESLYKNSSGEQYRRSIPFYKTTPSTQ